MRSRDSNFELLRILCMFCILCGHIVAQTNISENLNLLNQVCIYMFSSAFRIAVNVFVIIGAYFLVEKKFNINRVIKIWLITFFYGIFFTIIGKWILNLEIPWKDFFKVCLPISGHALWFTSAYIGILFFAPLWNSLLRINNGALAKYGIIITFLMFTGITTLIPANGGPYCSSDFIWLNYIYILTGYIRIYGISKKNKQRIISGGLIIYVFLVILRIIGYTQNVELLKYLTRYYLNTLSTLPVLLGSFSLFFIFENISFYNKRINHIAKSMFAVYVIHQVPIFRDWLWNGLFSFDKYANSHIFFLYFYGCGVLLFIMIILFDQLRLKIEPKLLGWNKLVYITKVFNRKVNQCEM